MSTKFHKISGTGNDFVVLDNRSKNLEMASIDIVHLCDRENGIGADGVIFLEESSVRDFKMVCYNADGSEAPMCGNAGRSIAFYASQVLQLVGNHCSFETKNSVYKAEIDGSRVKLGMNELSHLDAIDLSKFGDFENALYLDTGVAHAVFQVDDLDNYPVVKIGKKIREDALFENGTNVDFFECLADRKLFVRTYERGVEAETKSCGTGATAVAIAANRFFGWQEFVEIKTFGGDLKVSFDEKIQDIYIEGEVKLESEGSF